MDIIPYIREYRDDAIFCILSGKDALGRIPTINEDLLDIQTNYINRGDIFNLAIVDGRVVATLGTNTVSETDLWLKRLYVKPGFKRQGIASALLKSVEDYAHARGIKIIHTRFPEDYTQAALFYPSRGFIDYENDGALRHMIKNLKG